MGYDTKRLRELSGYVAVVGIGDTDYAKDYRKRGEAAPFDSYGLAATAFKRALEDSGLKKEDIDGVASCRYVNSENIIDILGLTPRWGSSLEAGESMVLTCAIQAIFSGMCDTVAVIYGNAQRSKGARYGGPRTGAGEGRLSEQYYHPWGWTSTGAHYAMMWQVYMDRYGAKEEDLGQIPVTLRRHAMLNDRAVMRTPITIDDYMASRYVCRPLHLFDYCIINDGGACLILRRADMANDLPHHPVLIDGLSWNSVRDNSQLRARMLDLYQTSIKTAGDECFAMAGMGPKRYRPFSELRRVQCHAGTESGGLRVLQAWRDGRFHPGRQHRTWGTAAL